MNLVVMFLEQPPSVHSWYTKAGQIGLISNFRPKKPGYPEWHRVYTDELCENYVYRSEKEFFIIGEL